MCAWCRFKHADGMQRTGTLRSWNDDRGFGFIAQTNGQADVFLHISELPRDGTRPTIGETMRYDIGRGKNGKPQAVNVVRAAFGDTRTTRKAPLPTRRSPASKGLPRFIFLLLLLALGAYGYRHYAQKVALYSKAAVVSPTRVEAAAPQVEPAPASASVRDGSRCDGRTHCSQMTSCTEAKYFLQNCPGTEMDGDHDGVPCEQQWCTSPFSK